MSSPSSHILKIGPGDTPPDSARNSGTYDQVVATIPVREVPYTWVQLVRPGGELVVSWHNAFVGPVVARLTVGDDGRASGTFVELDGSAGADEPAPVVADARGQVPWYHTTSTLDPDEVWADEAALFTLGIRLPRVHWTLGTDWPPGTEPPVASPADGDEGSSPAASNAEPAAAPPPRRRWIYDSSSCACVRRSPSGEVQVEQYGPRLLWREIEAAHRWWVDHDRPTFERFGLSVTSFGQFAWLGDRWSGRIWRL